MAGRAPDDRPAVARLSGDVLVTGFEPFGGAASNPSGDVALRLDGESLAGGRRVRGLVLPCVFGAARQALVAALRAHHYAVVLGLGLAASRRELSVERVAINLDDARIPDNAGAQPIDVPIVPGAPTAYFATLPVKAIAAALHASGLPGIVSQTAGTFVCNHVFYALMHHAATEAPSLRGGFLHLPPTEVLPLDRQVEAVRIALATTLATATDVRAVGGAVD